MALFAWPIFAVDISGGIKASMRYAAVTSGTTATTNVFAAGEGLQTKGVWRFWLRCVAIRQAIIAKKAVRTGGSKMAKSIRL